MVQLLVVVSYVAILSAGCWIAAGHGHRFQALFLAIPTGTLTIGTLTVFLAYSKQLYQPMRDLSKLMLLASNGASAAERIQEILDQPVEEPGPQASYQGPTELTGEIAYRGVVFGYSEDRPVLHGIDLEIPVGKRLALVGLSGSGKTTLVRLLPRFYVPSEGSITIDGVDVREIPLGVLRGNISLVLQDSMVFEGTVRDNIALGRPDATDDEIIHAAREAHIYDTIIDLPDGFNSQVREQGKNFSSGQRQRLSIARAILRDAPILILDEPTANLDVEAEAEVMRAVERLTAGRTVIVISHRLSTLGHVDEIAMLEGGRIVERGTYEQLKANGGAFARLLAQQNRYATEPISLGSANGGSANGGSANGGSANGGSANGGSANGVGPDHAPTPSAPAVTNGSAHAGRALNGNGDGTAPGPCVAIMLWQPPLFPIDDPDRGQQTEARREVAR
jgi:ABC-type multidrug transport system fused ATPase/permease subunit